MISAGGHVWKRTESIARPIRVSRSRTGMTTETRSLTLQLYRPTAELAHEAAPVALSTSSSASEVTGIWMAIRVEITLDSRLIGEARQRSRWARFPWT